MGRQDIYNTSKNMGKAVEKLRTLRETDKQDILRFKDEMAANNIGTLRVLKYMVTLRKVAEALPKPFRECTTEDLKAYIGNINSNPKMAEWTKHDYRILVKRFYKWLLGNDENYPEQVKWIKSTAGMNSKILPDELITREEAEIMAERTSHPRDRAFILMLFESGCRIGELLTLRLKNINFDSIGMIFYVTGKTGDRRVRILKYVKEMTAWLEMHPDKNDPESFLWTKNNSTGPIGYSGIVKCVKEAARKAGIKKRVYCHGFRHSRASELASMSFGEANMKEHLGWVQGSDMASVYIHLSGRNVDDALLRTNGMKLDDQTELKKVTVKRCPKCDANNNALSHFCVVCSHPIDAKGVSEIDEKRQQYDEFVRDFLKVIGEQVPQVKEIYRRMVKERELEKLFRAS